MKKYFMKGSGKEISFGDMVEVDFTKDMPNDKVKYYHMECRFLPELLPIFLENDVIEEKDIKDEDSEDKDSNIEDNIMKVLDNISKVTEKLIASNEEALKVQEDLEFRVDKLEENVTELIKVLALLNDKIKKNAKKTA